MICLPSAPVRSAQQVDAPPASRSESKSKNASRVTLGVIMEVPAEYMELAGALSKLLISTGSSCWNGTEFELDSQKFVWTILHSVGRNVILLRARKTALSPSQQWT